MDAVPFTVWTNLLYLLLVAGIWTVSLAVLAPGTGILEIFGLLTLGGAIVGMIFVPILCLDLFRAVEYNLLARR